LPRAFVVLLFLALRAAAEEPAAAGEPPAASPPAGLQVVPALGFAWFRANASDGRRNASGVALELHLDGQLAPRFWLGATLTWGLTDWDRAREWIDAGNRAGRWTTDAFANVEAWVRRGSKDDQGLRLLGAFFADFFLAFTYLAVPICYVGSVGGATSHLQLDATGSFHLAGAPTDTWGEVGAGAAALPQRGGGWRQVFGPLAGVGMRIGRLRIGARVLWSPPPFNSTGGASVLTGALTAGLY
jgi:hypothetical protein